MDLRGRPENGKIAGKVPAILPRPPAKPTVRDLARFAHCFTALLCAVKEGWWFVAQQTQIDVSLAPMMNLILKGVR